MNAQDGFWDDPDLTTFCCRKDESRKERVARTGLDNLYTFFTTFPVIVDKCIVYRVTNVGFFMRKIKEDFTDLRKEMTELPEEKRKHLLREMTQRWVTRWEEELPLSKKLRVSYEKHALKKHAGKPENTGSCLCFFNKLKKRGKISLPRLGLP